MCGMWGCMEQTWTTRYREAYYLESFKNVGKDKGKNEDDLYTVRKAN